MRSSLQFLDPPRHHQLRRLVSQAFTPRVVEQLVAHITSVVSELLDSLHSSDRLIDFATQIASPLPALVIASLLGVSPHRQNDFRRWADVALAAPGPGAPQEIATAYQRAKMEMAEYMTQIIEERRVEPRDDLISHLITAEIEGQRLTGWELLSFCELLLINGNKSTFHLMNAIVLCFDRYPEALAHVRARPEVLPGAIEEVLRFLAPLKATVRRTREKTLVGGRQLAKDQEIVAWIESANHDENHFDSPEQFMIERTPNHHLSFGFGIHACLGSHLARLEARVALQAMFERFAGQWSIPDVFLDALKGPGPSTAGIMGVKHLPLTWEA
ncbi:cytochrome P450 [Ktedonospora formicarum]|uniref:Cytochrome P450 n=1 Tax=Ktedonospora formicarum TaxID=2778364 RepID=A0A8J3I445_9CHLR|nr:cytochrome P450 [Ktedonospora formicarum]